MTYPERFNIEKRRREREIREKEREAVYRERQGKDAKEGERTK